ncbi:hypothetical protein Tco_0115388 [Tanacetum coccineum]
MGYVAMIEACLRANNMFVDYKWVSEVSRLHSFLLGCSSTKCDTKWDAIWGKMLTCDWESAWLSVADPPAPSLVFVILLPAAATYNHEVVHIKRPSLLASNSIHGSFSLVLRIDKILPLVENADSDATEEAWTLNISRAMRDRTGTDFAFVIQNPK